MAERSLFWNGVVTGDAVDAPYDANTEFANYIKRGFGLGGARPNAGVVYGSGASASQLEGLQVTQNSPAGMSVLLNIGAAHSDGTEYYNDSALTLSITANASGNARIDTVVLRKSFAAQTVRAVVLQGTPAASPVAPSLTQSAGVTWEIPIADIAVANAAVSISNTNITPTAHPINAADGVYLDRFNGGINPGTVAVLDTSAARTALTTTSAQSSGIVGAVVGKNSGGAFTRYLNRGIGYVLTDGAVAIGDYGHTSTSTGLVTSSGSKIRINSFCRFIETTTGAGLALAFIDAGIHPQFGSIGGTTLSIAAAALAVTGLPAITTITGTLVIEIMARSAIAATTEIVSLRVGGVALDTTAGNYFSYSHLVANSTPAVTALSNLGATAGFQFTIVGNTAPANVYSHVILHIAFAYSTTLNKIATGISFMPSSTTNGTIYNIQIGGRWVNAADAITQLSLITNGANNLMAGSYMNVYFKDVA